MKKTVSFLIAAALATGCASTYTISPQPADTQVPVFSDQGNLIRSSKVNDVQAGPISNATSVHSNLRFYVQLKNNTNNPIEFSPAQVTAQLNDQAATVVSYEAQLQDVQNRLANYGLRISIGGGYHGRPYSGFGFGFGHGSTFGGFGWTPFSRAGWDASLDNLDIQRAYEDLNRIEQFALKPKVVKPGEEYGGEVVIAARLSAEPRQVARLKILAGEETHEFEFHYDRSN